MSLPTTSRSLGCLWSLSIALLLFAAIPQVNFAGVPRVLPPGQLPHDQRLEPLKDLDGYFPFTPSASSEEWSKRAAQVRQQMLVALGLWPMPTKTPLNPVIHGKLDLGDYTVEKVYFESVPGFYVTGNLYRPKDKPGRLPGVLCPHGHWDNGRFTDAGLDGVRRQIVQGAERFEDGGRSPLQSRCVQLARMGCVVFHYDMIGYADSRQISEQLAHGFAAQRPEMNTTENWGLFSPQAEAHLQSVMGLQTWDSIRALDFLVSLPDVDSQRVAVTGASGGGTQTFVLCGLDPRPAVAFPAVMVSTAMQGGCTCENACLMRVDTGNVEFAALFAPKPLGMTAADDWTHEMPTKGFPELKQHFAMLGAPDNVMLKPLLHFGHNYNYVSRAAMYSWFNTQLHLGFAEPVVEEGYRRLSAQELSVWDDEHPKPPAGPEFERSLLHWLSDDAAKQLETAAQSLDSFRKVYGGALDVIIGRNLDHAGKVDWDPAHEEDRGSCMQVAGVLRNTTHHEELPALLLRPKQWSGRTVVWLAADGKAGLFTSSGDNGNSSAQLKPEINRLLGSGAAVLGVDLLYQGEFLSGDKPLTRTPSVKNPREAAAYTFGYNRTVFAQRVHDVLTAIRFARQNSTRPESVDLVALDETGPIAAAARAHAQGAVDHAAINTGGFRFANVLDIHDPAFLPGGAKYGDLPGMLALAAPGKLWLQGEGEQVPQLLGDIYAKTGQPMNRIKMAGQSGQAEELVAWLLE
jgi:dienelactone hydrolase